MTILIGQIVGCLLVAAAIGGAVGWLLRNLSATSLKQQYLELNSALRSKEQALQTALYDLKVKASAMQILESNIKSAEALMCSTQQELSGRNERLQALQEELAVRTQRLTVLEAEEASVRRRASEYDAAAAAQTEEVSRIAPTRQPTGRPGATNRRAGTSHPTASGARGNTDTVGNKICPDPQATRRTDRQVTKTTRGTGPTPSPAPAR